MRTIAILACRLAPSPVVPRNEALKAVVVIGAKFGAGVDDHPFEHVTHLEPVSRGRLATRAVRIRLID